MKQLAAIFFLSVLVFNFYGYRLVISCMQDRNDAVLEKQLDRNEYSDDELISIKTTLNLPYYTSSPDYERAYGSINIDGVDYEYVKRRVYQDTLELLCLPNHTKTKLQTAGNEIAKAAVDGDDPVPAKKGIGAKKIGFPDFFQEKNLSLFSATISEKQTYLSLNTSFSFFDFTSRQDRPPQSIQHFI